MQEPVRWKRFGLLCSKRPTIQRFICEAMAKAMCMRSLLPRIRPVEMCIRDRDWIEGIKDSKKVAEKKREQLAEQIRQKAIAYGIGMADEAEIETHNILGATKLAMRRAYQAMNRPDALVLIDAIDPAFLPAPGAGIIKGDAQSYAIASASLLAKVTRDTMMKELDVQYPAYGFARNKGYGTKEHRDAILLHGVCPAHRMSFLQGILHGK